MSRRRRRRLANLGPDGWPPALRWRPRVRVFGIISGMLGGLGTVVLIQQYGLAPLGRALTLQGLAGGALSGIIVPSLVYAVVVRRYNRKLAAARAGGPRRPSGAYGVGMTLLFVTFFSALLALGSVPAIAEIDGPCELTVNGINVRNIAVSREDAIPVVSENPVTGYISSPSDFQAFEVRFYYAGFSYGFGDSEIDDDPDGGGGSGTFELPADLLFRYAGGLYEVRARGPLANGQYCEYSMLFDVDRNPLETPVGKAAAATTALGAVGVLGVAAGAAVEGTRMIGDLGTMLTGLPGPAGAAEPAGKGGTGWSGAGTQPPPATQAPTGTKVGAGRSPAGPGTPVPAGEAGTERLSTPGGATPPTASLPAADATVPDTAAKAGHGQVDGVPPGGPGTPGPAEAVQTPVAWQGMDDQASPAGPDPGFGIDADAAGQSEPVAALDGPSVEAGGKGAGGPLGGGTLDSPGKGPKGAMAGSAVPGVVGSAAGAIQEGGAGVPLGEAFWFYVEEPTPLVEGADSGQVAGRLTPGTWYLAKESAGDWVQVVDAETGQQGWVPARVVKRPNP